MDKRRFKVKAGSVLNSAAFFEASKEELRVLVTIMQCPLTYSDEAQIAEAAKVSPARAAAAIALFSEAGIICREGDVTLEFEKHGNVSDSIDRPAAEIAETIRRKKLSELFSELAEMMGKETLNRDEVEKLTSLTTDLVLTEEYILILAEHLLARGRLSVLNILKEAKKLDRMDVHTPEELEEYLKIRENSSSLEWAFRKTFGKYGDKISRVELDYYSKWTEVFGFSDEIILLAMDVNVRSKTKYSYAYMDTLLERWHECGCKTVEECTKQSESDRARIAEERKRESAPTRRASKKSEAPTPKYGNFDPSEALERALAKSFAKATTDDKK